MDPLVSRRSNSRDAILDAAEAIVADAGAAHLTLDAAAERAGVSKGGLLYNFPTKEALLRAMVARLIERKGAMHAKLIDDLPPGPDRELKAMLLNIAAGGGCSHAKHLGVAMIAASANDPKLLEPIRERHRTRLAQLESSAREDGLPFERAAVISLALDGLMLTEMLQISPLSARQRERVLDDLMALVDETTKTATSMAHPRRSSAKLTPLAA